ncbi:MAG: LysM peptidoglycan-binding domain-containing protein [Deltaproteobacteria bacterium]|nr:MAG: LysM peptidoglycan-binding domain-containing protein [Deltaproteobacteria bacterium]
MPVLAVNTIEKDAILAGMSRRLSTILSLLICLALVPVSVPAWHPRGRDTGPWPTLPEAVGHDRLYYPAPGETLMEVARRAGLGFSNLRRANPELDPWRLPVGAPILLPLRVRLPDDLDSGITIDLAGMRLWWAHRTATGWQIRWYPIGIGREGFTTPSGEFQVTTVVDHPTWFPPETMRATEPDLPPAVPPGPDNPLGDIWIGTSAPGIGIHGTNRPFGVGRRVSHGCIRLYPEDIRDLARRVAPGTPIRIRMDTGPDLTARN